MIRPARTEDMAQLLELLLAADGQMGFTSRFGCGVNHQSMAKVLETALSMANTDLSVVELEGRVAGACLVEVTPFLWDARTLLAYEHVWHMHPGWPNGRQKREWFMRMYLHMRAWACGQGAKSFTINVAPGGPAARFLSRRGMAHCENVYTGGL